MSGFVIGDDHPALPGHFPGRPIVPGVVILDRVLDAIEAAHGPLGALRLPQVKFLRPLLPGQDAWVETEEDARRVAADAMRGEVGKSLAGDVDLGCRRILITKD